MRQLKGRNMYNKIVSVILGLIQGVKDLIGTPEPTPKQAKHQTEVTKEVPSKKGLVASYNDWFDKANAKYYRDTFSLYAPIIFKNVGDYEKTFSPALDEFFYGHGRWSHVYLENCNTYSTFPSIHVSFLKVQVFELKETWNRRGLKLRDLITLKLRSALVKRMASQGGDYSAVIDYVITQVWWVDDWLFIEMPDSTFPYMKPGLFSELVPEKYPLFKKELECRNRL